MLEGITFPTGGDRLHAVLSMARFLNHDEIGATIDALIARLDASEPDSDMEDGHDAEPCDEDLGAEERGEGSSWPEIDDRHDLRYAYADDEREDDCCEVREAHRQRIRRARCTKVEHGRWGSFGFSTYDLPGAFSRARTGFASDLLS